MVPFWVLDVIRHLVFRDPKGDHNFDNQSHLDSIMLKGVFRNQAIDLHLYLHLHLYLYPYLHLHLHLYLYLYPHWFGYIP